MQERTHPADLSIIRNTMVSSQNGPLTEPLAAIRARNDAIAGRFLDSIVINYGFWEALSGPGMVVNVDVVSGQRGPGRLVLNMPKDRYHRIDVVNGKEVAIVNGVCQHIAAFVSAGINAQVGDIVAVPGIYYAERLGTHVVATSLDPSKLSPLPRKKVDPSRYYSENFEISRNRYKGANNLNDLHVQFADNDRRVITIFTTGLVAKPTTRQGEVIHAREYGIIPGMQLATIAECPSGPLLVGVDIQDRYTYIMVSLNGYYNESSWIVIDRERGNQIAMYDNGQNTDVKIMARLLKDRLQV